MSEPPHTPRPSGRPGDEDVDEITVRLRDCNIRVRLSPGGRAAASPTAPAFSSASSSAGFSVVTEDVSARVPLAGASPFGLEILDLLTPEELEKVDLKHLESQARLLGSLGGGWSSRARIARAIRAGVGAREVLEGHRPVPPSSPAVPVKNRFYIALRTAARPQGFWTESSRVFFREVSGPDGARFGPEVVSHSFASRAELTAYLAGAGRGWPQEL